MAIAGVAALPVLGRSYLP
ncbi:unnamed protein product [Victoria cruziana]